MSELKRYDMTVEWDGHERYVQEIDDPQGEWIKAEEARARIAELEAQLSTAQATSRMLAKMLRKYNPAGVKRLEVFAEKLNLPDAEFEKWLAEGMGLDPK